MENKSRQFVQEDRQAACLRQYLHVAKAGDLIVFLPGEDSPPLPREKSGLCVGKLLCWDEEELSVVVAVGSRSFNVFSQQVWGYPFLPHL